VARSRPSKITQNAQILHSWLTGGNMLGPWTMGQTRRNTSIISGAVSTGKWSTAGFTRENN